MLSLIQKQCMRDPKNKFVTRLHCNLTEDTSPREINRAAQELSRSDLNAKKPRHQNHTAERSHGVPIH